MITYAEKLQQIPAEICSVADYEINAKTRLPQAVWEYIASGSADEVSLSNNRLAFDKIKIWNRVLCDLSKGNTRCQLGKQTLAHPILLSPVAHQKLVDTNGERATAQAAEATDTLMTVSSLSSLSLEEIATSTTSEKWFQLYWQCTRKNSLTLLRRAEEAGYSTIVITVDVPINGLRRRIQRAGFSVPKEVESDNSLAPGLINRVALSDSEVFQGWMAQAPTWNDIEWLIAQTRLPVILKGILHPADALQAQSIGAQGIIMSNHGGRALDGTPAPIEILPIIRERLGAYFPILIDSGIRQGSDIFKAIALGANAVMIGRPQLYGLSVAGALGVAHLIQLLRQELEVTMALAGCATLTDIDKHCLMKPGEDGY